MGLLTRHRSSFPTSIDRMRDEFDRALQNFWGGNGDFESMLPASEWQPSVDISETDQALQVKVDLPGIKPEDVEISVSEDRLTIKGERKEEAETDDKETKVHRIERRYGSFYRSIALPPGTKAEDVVAEADNGVITIHLPKGEVSKAKRVAVKAK
ncbi:Spore protein SP21 [Stieleria maiorica]|uniref:Spore protein SP21 n=1 Tax=Stieleria maiorica TaxID=2795974 RepID=A0A5B9MK70_9BACT|nr:Hsp20/alpha crystallin family protein [Stieleria maiorica]QEG01763.1 Spore protein SP21 [Stieleria maiorica]